MQGKLSPGTEIWYPFSAEQQTLWMNYLKTQLDTIWMGSRRNWSNVWQDDCTWKTSALGKRKIFSKKLFSQTNFWLQKNLRTSWTPSESVKRQWTYSSRLACSEAVLVCSLVLQLQNYQFSGKISRCFGCKTTEAKNYCKLIATKIQSRPFPSWFTKNSPAKYHCWWDKGFLLKYFVGVSKSAKKNEIKKA